ncbi:MAG: pirin family protein [Burkholderiaceae bacterium]
MATGSPLMLEGHVKDIGSLDVRRMLPSARRRRVGPFVFFDHFGPAVLPAGEGMDVRPHPHIGLSTLSYLFDGQILHRDSLGFTQAIEPGAVNWMTAGRGIVHSERTAPDWRARDFGLHGVQIWIALPDGSEETEPAFTHHPADSLPVIEREGLRMILLAGSAYDSRSPVPTHSPLFCLHAELRQGATLSLPDGYAERAAYLVSGKMRYGGAELNEHQLLVVDGEAPARLTAVADSRLVLFGGAPLASDRIVWWNFVARDRDRLEAAKADWREGRFAAVPGDDEFIPLPSD